MGARERESEREKREDVREMEWLGMMRIETNSEKKSIILFI